MLAFFVVCVALLCVVLSVFVSLVDLRVSVCLFVLSCVRYVLCLFGLCVMCCLLFASFLNSVCVIVVLLVLICASVLLCFCLCALCFVVL